MKYGLIRAIPGKFGLLQPCGKVQKNFENQMATFHPLWYDTDQNMDRITTESEWKPDPIAVEEIM